MNLKRKESISILSLGFQNQIDLFGSVGSFWGLTGYQSFAYLPEKRLLQRKLPEEEP